MITHKYLTRLGLLAPLCMSIFLALTLYAVFSGYYMVITQGEPYTFAHSLKVIHDLNNDINGQKEIAWTGVWRYFLLAIVKYPLWLIFVSLIFKKLKETDKIALTTFIVLMDSLLHDLTGKILIFIYRHTVTYLHFFPFNDSFVSIENAQIVLTMLIAPIYFLNYFIRGKKPSQKLFPIVGFAMVILPYIFHFAISSVLIKPHIFTEMQNLDRQVEAHTTEQWCSEPTHFCGQYDFKTNVWQWDKKPATSYFHTNIVLKPEAFNVEEFFLTKMQNYHLLDMQKEDSIYDYYRFFKVDTFDTPFHNLSIIYIWVDKEKNSSILKTGYRYSDLQHDWLVARSEFLFYWLVFVASSFWIGVMYFVLRRHERVIARKPLPKPDNSIENR